MDLDREITKSRLFNPYVTSYLNLLQARRLGDSVNFGNVIFTIGDETIEKFEINESHDSIVSSPEIIFRSVEDGWSATMFNSKYDTCV